MKRDMDLIRELLLQLEAIRLPTGSHGIVTADAEEVAVEGFSYDQIAYHLDLIREAGLIEYHRSQPAIGIAFSRLSWEGHDFLDSVRSSEVWRKTKHGAEAAGGFTMELLKNVAVAIVKGQIETHTGLKLP